MKRSNFIYIAIICTLFNFILGQNTNDEWIKGLPKPWMISEEKLNEIMPEFHSRYPVFEERLKALYLWSLGTPYGVFKFGEEKEPDTDPIIRMDSTDCTSHILCYLSLSQSKNWTEARKNMVKLHYKHKYNEAPVAEYTLRWHYTLDRINNNPSTVNITELVVDPRLLVLTQINLNKKEDGGEFLPLNWNEKTPLIYVPSESVDESVLNSLPKLAGIAFVKESYFKMGIAMAHEGVLIDNKTLIHASSDAGETVAVDLLEYLHREGGPIFDGIMVYRFVPLKK